jgi:hypothetical protein
MLYLKIEVLQVLIYSFKKKKQKRNDSFLQQRMNKEICKLPYLEDFEANVEVAEDKILAHRQNVEVTNAEWTKRRTTKRRKTKRRMGQNIQWKKPRMGQNIEWN